MPPATRAKTVGTHAKLPRRLRSTSSIAHAFLTIRELPTGIAIDSSPGARRILMLVEGGYLHSMKRLIEKAEQMPDPSRRSRPDPKRGVIGRSLARLAKLLRPRQTRH